MSEGRGYERIRRGNGVVTSSETSQHHRPDIPRIKCFDAQKLTVGSSISETSAPYTT